MKIDGMFGEMKEAALTGGEEDRKDENGEKAEKDEKK